MEVPKSQQLGSTWIQESPFSLLSLCVFQKLSPFPTSSNPLSPSRCSLRFENASLPAHQGKHFPKNQDQPVVLWPGRQVTPQSSLPPPTRCHLQCVPTPPTTALLQQAPYGCSQQRQKVECHHPMMRWGNQAASTGLPSTT